MFLYVLREPMWEIQDNKTTGPKKHGATKKQNDQKDTKEMQKQSFNLVKLKDATVFDSTI